jgi:P-type Ca2+ transporter type 2C
MENNFDIIGLNHDQVLAARKQFGPNLIEIKEENRILQALIGYAKDPMIVLLLVAASIYFISGKPGDAIFLVIAIFLVVSISSFQASRSNIALEKLKDFTKPHCTVIRNGKEVKIKTADLVVGDCLIIEEGSPIAADGLIIHSNDFSVNESILTGESLAVFKDKTSENNKVFQGTSAATGLAIARITAIGMQTELSKIGASLQKIEEGKTPLETQITNFVKKMAIIGAVVFVIVWALNYYQSALLMDSLLKSLTLAMSILPEEIPVAYTTFMALGAWRLMKKGVVVKKMETVETLGSATIICTDKTGTLTENRMSLAKIFDQKSGKIVDIEVVNSDSEKELIRIAMWASEPIPFDPMEKALHESYKNNFEIDERPNYKLIHEYPLGGTPPMMTHIFGNNLGNMIVAAKGAPEAILAVSNLSIEEKTKVKEAIKALSSDGFRLLAVGLAEINNKNFPKKQQDFEFAFMGIVAFYDPPKKNISRVLNDFYKAGINVKIITGDNAETTQAIAKQVNFKGFEKSISGEELLKLSDNDLKMRVMDTQIFTRMFPDAKLKIISALKSQNQIVAMTGDGVNDGPALKAANIGVAMGKKGTEIAKEAASLILVKDDLSKMVEAVAMGRRIYTNLKKAIRFVISIHIPIILTVFIPLALGWIYPNIFSPVHIIFLELIMGPTCSIIYENEPIEKNTMVQLPRPYSDDFFSAKELIISGIQGLMITAGTMIAYQYAVQNGADEGLTRTMVFTTLITANIFLTLVNRSFYYSIFTTLGYKNNLILLIIGITIFISAMLLYIKPLSNFFEFSAINFQQLVISIAIGFASVIWIEFYKLWKRQSHKFAE